MERAANSTPIVLLLSALNSLVVKRISKLDLPTPESPIKTTKNVVRICLLIRHVPVYS